MQTLGLRPVQLDLIRSKSADRSHKAIVPWISAITTTTTAATTTPTHTAAIITTTGISQFQVHICGNAFFRLKTQDDTTCTQRCSRKSCSILYITFRFLSRAFHWIYTEKKNALNQTISFPTSPIGSMYGMFQNHSDVLFSSIYPHFRVI